jgi:acyl carrier protein
VLGHEHAGATDSFFDSGGNSLQAMQLIGALDDELGVDIGVAAVFLAPAPRQLAALLRDQHGLQDDELGPDGLDGFGPPLPE